MSKPGLGGSIFGGGTPYHQPLFHFNPFGLLNVAPRGSSPTSTPAPAPTQAGVTYGPSIAPAPSSPASASSGPKPGFMSMFSNMGRVGSNKLNGVTAGLAGQVAGPESWNAGAEGYTPVDERVQAGPDLYRKNWEN